ncbi:alginate lyase family protein (plasmid) [Rhizobium sp. WW22]|uniref:alginate lyase family protein n=1 Tax=Rhizobium sp. WW22 TaxID=3389070 RepID=UPI00399A9ABA
MVASVKMPVGRKRVYSAMLLAMFIACMLPITARAEACKVPPPMSAFDPPGFYDDPDGYGRAIKPLHAFIEQVNKAADIGDKACVVALLDTWARANALMGPINGYQGYFERSWAGTDFALALLRLFPQSKSAAPAVSPAISKWLIEIATSTRDADAINHLHNNLVYWASLDLTAIGTLTKQPDLVDAGIARAREGINDIQPNGTLERELNRGDRALHYHNFALIPLVFTAELAQARHVDLYAENNGAIRRLANLVIEAVLDPSSFSAYSSTPQHFFPWTFAGDLAWMEPYQARFHDPQLMALIAQRRPFINPRLGGNVTVAWSGRPATGRSQ